jgi:hypothetical protein
LLETFGSQAAALTAIQSEEIADRKFTLEVSTPNATHRTVTLEPKPCLSWLPSLEVRSDKIAIITLYQFWFNSDIADSPQRWNGPMVVLTNGSTAALPSTWPS